MDRTGIATGEKRAIPGGTEGGHLGWGPGVQTHCEAPCLLVCIWFLGPQVIMQTEAHLVPPCVCPPWPLSHVADA